MFGPFGKRPVGSVRFTARVPTDWLIKLPLRVQPPVLPVAQDSETIASSVKVYPNPASHSLTIDMTGVSGTVQRIELIDNLGKTMRIMQLRSQKTIEVINVSGLPTGFYFVRAIKKGEAPETQKVLIRH